MDADTGQVGPEIAAMLGMAQVTGATSLHIDGSKAIVGRETDEGVDTLSVDLPVLLTASERLIRPPRFDAAQLEQAKSAQIETLSVAMLGLSPQEVGFDGSPTWVSGINEVKPERTPVVVQESDAIRASKRVLELLQERKVFEEISQDRSRAAAAGRQQSAAR